MKSREITGRKMIKKIWDTIIFAWAAMFGATVGLLACISILAREWLENKKKRETYSFLADKKRTMAFYKILSKVYDMINPFFYTNAMRASIVDLAEINQNSYILDVGCGTGYTTEEISRRAAGGEIVAVDMTLPQLRKAVRKLKSLKNMLFLRGDAENLPFKNNVFGAVVSVGAIEYFQNPKKVVQEMRRVLKKKGKVVIGAPNLEWFKKLNLDRILYTPAKGDLQRIYTHAGLKEVKVVLDGVDTFFSTDNYVIVASGAK